MTREEKIEQIENEIKEMYHEFFEDEKKQDFKNENQANEFSERFHNRLFEFIKEKKKELKIDDNTQK